MLRLGWFWLAVGLWAQQPTTVTLATSANPLTFGQALTMTATISPSSASGKVTFYDGTTVLGVQTLSGGKAALTTSLLPTGSRSLRAYYAGGGGFAASTSAVFVESVMTLPANGFLPPVTYTPLSNPYSVAVADFNGDGKADCVVTANGMINVFLGIGDGRFAFPVMTFVNLSVYYDLVTGDFNGDGNVDIAFATSTGVAVMLGNGNGTFQSPTLYLPGTIGLVAGDFNGDGKIDLVAGNSVSGYVTTLLGNGDGTFQVGPSVNTGVSPIAMTVGDFDGDGKADLAVTGISNTASMQVLLGNGDGSFRLSAVNYGANTAGFQIANGDLNGDGKPDLVITGVATTDVLLGNGDGTFRSGPTYNVGFQPGDNPVAIADMNGDGKPDLVLMQYVPPLGPSYIIVYYGNGDGTFQQPLSYKVPSYANAIAIGDFNVDGRADLAIVDSGEMEVLLGEIRPLTSTSLASAANPSKLGQALTLTATVSGGSPTGSAAFYDGATLLGANALVNGQASLTLTTFASGTHSLTAVYSGDTQYIASTSPVLTQVVNGVLAPATLTLTSSTNPSKYGQPLTLTATLSPASASGLITFYDGSILLDSVAVLGGQAKFATGMLSAGSHVITAFYGGDAANAPGKTAMTQSVTTTAALGFTPAFSIPAGVLAPISIAAGDFNGDGKTDYVVVNSVANSQVVVFLSNGDGTFGTPISSQAGSYAGEATVGDINGDGKADLILDNGLVLLGNGDGTFRMGTNIGVRGRYVVGDFNGDGKPDLATNGYVWLGNGDGTFQVPLSPAASGIMAIGDFNNDGKADLAVSTGTNVTILLGNGNGTFRTAASYAELYGSYEIVVADFNGDGKPDLAMTNDASISVYLGNGDGTFQPVVTYAAPAGGVLNSLVAADLNGDGKIDLATCGFSPGVLELLGNGDGTFQPAVSFGAGIRLEAMGLADFNGDGRPDLVVADYGSTAGNGNANVSILLAGIAEQLQFATTPPAMQVVGTVIPPIVVDLVDSNFNLITGSPVPVTLTSSPAAINVTVSTVNGVATFSGLVIGTIGTYTLTASAPQVSPISTTFNVVPPPPTVMIEGPAPGATLLAGTATILGWAAQSVSAGATPVASVQVLVDGTPMGSAIYGLVRNDICGQTPLRLGCPNIGYRASANLGPGTHVITVVATNSGVGTVAGSASVTVSVLGLMTGTKAAIFRNNSAFLADTPGEEMYDANNDRYIPSFKGPGGFVTGDVPVAGDWTGEGHIKVGIYRASTGTWFLDANNNGVYDAGDLTYSFGGLTGDLPVVGDWLSKGKSCIGIYRANGSVWLLDLNCNGSFDNTPLDAFFPFGGIPGDVPVVGAWTGSGTRVGVVRKYAPGGVPQGNPFYWVLDAGAANAGNLPANHPPAANPFAFGGLNGDVYVTGDWYNTGVWTAGVYRAGFWVLDAALPGSPQANHIVGLAFGFGGIPGDVPVPAKW